MRKKKSQNQCLIVVFDEKQAFMPFSFSVIGPISKTVDDSSFRAVVDKLPWFKADNTWKRILKKWSFILLYVQQDCVLVMLRSCFFNKRLFDAGTCVVLDMLQAFCSTGEGTWSTEPRWETNGRHFTWAAMMRNNCLWKYSTTSKALPYGAKRRGVGGLYSCIGTLTYWAGGLTLVQMSCHKWSIQAEHTTGLQTTTTTDHVMVLATIKEKHKGRKTEKPVAKINVIHAIVDITA